MSLSDDKVRGRIYDHRLAVRLLRYLRPYRWVVLASITTLALASALRLAGPYLTRVAIDDHIATGDVAGLAMIARLFVLILVLQTVISFVQTLVTSWTGQRIMHDLRTEIFSHVQRLHVGYFDRHPVGRIMTRMTNDVDVLNELFTSGVVSIVGDLVSLIGIVAIMLWLDWRLALLALAVVPLLFAATLVFKVKVRDTYRRVRTAVAAINAFLQENITGMSIVQIFVQEKRKFGEFDQRNRTHLDANLDSIFYYAVYYPIVNLIGALSIALIIWYGGLRHLDQTVTLGILVAFIQYSERFYKPISDLSERFNVLQSAMASSERIFDLLDTEPAIVAPAAALPAGEFQGEIEFREVDFSYEPGVPVLKGVNLHILPGEKVAIVGATGSGKSTMINLISRFYDVNSGAVLVDGTDVRQWDLDRLRQQIGVVLQDVFLFSGSVEQNIRLWRAPVDDGQMREAARQVHADSFIEALSDQYRTAVSERGGSLSVGQRQLLAFARALAHDPKLLVLDEATSSVDTETEQLIQDALEKLIEDRTSLIVAHRLSTIQHCDRIVVVHKGEIVEQGTHGELLNRGGIYTRLYELQYKDQLAQRSPPPSPSVEGVTREA